MNNNRINNTQINFAILNRMKDKENLSENRKIYFNNLNVEGCKSVENNDIVSGLGIHRKNGIKKWFGCQTNSLKKFNNIKSKLSKFEGKAFDEIKTAIEAGILVARQDIIDRNTVKAQTQYSVHHALKLKYLDNLDLSKIDIDELLDIYFNISDELSKKSGMFKAKSYRAFENAVNQSITSSSESNNNIKYEWPTAADLGTTSGEEVRRLRLNTLFSQNISNEITDNIGKAVTNASHKNAISIISNPQSAYGYKHVNSLFIVDGKNSYTNHSTISHIAMSEDKCGTGQFTFYNRSNILDTSQNKGYLTVSLSPYYKFKNTNVNFISTATVNHKEFNFMENGDILENQIAKVQSVLTNAGCDKKQYNFYIFGSGKNYHILALCIYKTYLLGNIDTILQISGYEKQTEENNDKHGRFDKESIPYMSDIVAGQLEGNKVVFYTSNTGKNTQPHQAN